MIIKEKKINIEGIEITFSDDDSSSDDDLAEDDLAEDDLALNISSMFRQQKSLDQILLFVLHHAIVFHDKRYRSPDNVMAHITLPFNIPSQHNVVLWMQQVM